MAITSTQTPGTDVRNFAVGRYIDDGTVAAFDITTGFQPRYVRVQNVTSGDNMEWFEGMDDASGVKRLTNGTASLVTENGITVAANGFTVGLDVDICYTSEQLSWIAIG